MELSKDESEDIFLSSLCNAVSTGWMAGYGLELICEDEDYQEAESKLKNPCVEDVWMEILRSGKKLKFVDHESGEWTRSISLEDVHERVSKTPVEHLANFLTEDSDVESADAVLQTVFFEDLIFA